jgi:hypothetical protein
MRSALALFGFALIAVSGWSETGPAIPADLRVTAFTNGSWFDGHSFKKRTGYAVGEALSFRRPPHVDAVVDLKGGFVVPPFGEAHNHNVEPLNKIDDLIQRYLNHGIFYIKDPDNLPSARDKVLPKVNQPESIDVIFSNGGFTGSNGHPSEIVKRNVDRGIWAQADGDGAFYYAVDNPADLERKWPQFLATKPGFVKTYLLYSEDYAERKDNDKYDGWKGLDPTLLALIVRRAHAAGLRVSTHIESAADFHNALSAGVDEINHMPGFRPKADVSPHALSEFQISESDAKLASRQGTYVVTTLGGIANIDPNGEDGKLRRELDALNARNLRLLKKYRVKIALGSDSYRSDTLPEAFYLESLHAFDDRSLLTSWCTTTAKTIFPNRKVGELREGYEANFVVLSSNPLQDFSAVQHVIYGVKQGHLLDRYRTVIKRSKTKYTPHYFTR